MVYGAGKHQYELLDTWAKYPPGWEMFDIGGLSVDAQDRVYVLNRGAHPIMIFDREGNLLKSWGADFFNRAHGSCIGPDGSVYCTDDRDHIVAKFTSEGELLMTMGTRGQHTENGYVRTFDFWESLGRIERSSPPFNRPTGVALSAAGEIYVADGYGNASIHKFTPDGTLMFSWGEPGGRPGQFRLPHTVKVDKQERVWIPDRENHRVQIFDAEGKFLDQWTDFIRPTDVCFDGEGTVYVSEMGLRVSILSGDGEFLARWGNTGLDKESALFLAPHAIAVDSHGDIYVGEVSKTHAGVDKGPRVVQKFVRKR